MSEATQWEERAQYAELERDELRAQITKLDPSSHKPEDDDPYWLSEDDGSVWTQDPVNGFDYSLTEQQVVERLNWLHIGHATAMDEACEAEEKERESLRAQLAQAQKELRQQIQDCEDHDVRPQLAAMREERDAAIRLLKDQYLEEYMQPLAAAPAEET